MGLNSAFKGLIWKSYTYRYGSVFIYLQKQHRQGAYNITLKRVRATIAAVEKW